MKAIFFLISLLALSGCNRFAESSKYSLIASSDGIVYRLDRSSGEVWSIRQGLFSKVSEATEIPLIIGGFYAIEDGTVVKYIGKGKFESGHGLSVESKKEALRNKLGLGRKEDDSDIVLTGEKAERLKELRKKQREGTLQQ